MEKSKDKREEAPSKGPGAREALLSEAEKKQVADRLQEKRVRGDCPMCGNSSWTIADGYFNQPIQGELKGMVLGGPSIPSAAIICTNCGFISQHALGALGLLPRKEEEES